MALTRLISTVGPAWRLIVVLGIRVKAVRWHTLFVRNLHSVDHRVSDQIRVLAHMIHTHTLLIVIVFCLTGYMHRREAESACPSPVLDGIVMTPLFPCEEY